MMTDKIEEWRYWYEYSCGCRLKKKFYGTEQPGTCWSCKASNEQRAIENEEQAHQNHAEEALFHVGFSDEQIIGLREWMERLNNDS